MNDPFHPIKQDVSTYYTEKVLTFGTIPQGVDWNSLESQELRFSELLKICNGDSDFTLNDVGCGYGYLFEYMMRHSLRFHYRGFDLSEEMIKLSQERYREFKNCQFFSENTLSHIADYTVASGILNVKLQYETKTWEEYVIKVLHELDGSSRKGFSFNILTSYSDPEYMRENLYYADPCFYFDYCKRNFSKNVALLHDYGLYEFTILVRKNLEV